MNSDYSYSSELDEEKKSSTSKKRKKRGRIKDVMKVLRAESHEIGPDCSCKKLRCFETVPENERKRIIREFNALGDNDKQNSYLGGLITVLPVRRRGSKEDQTRFNTASFAYRVLLLQDGVARDVKVCLKAFMSMHGISEDKVRYIRNALVATGKSPTDKRGKHSNRPHKLTEETLAKMDTAFLKSLNVCDLPVSSGCHSELKQTWQMASVRLLVDQKLQAIDTKRKKSVLISEQQRQKGEVKKKDEQQLKLEKQSKKTEKTIEDENEDKINQLSNNAVLIQAGDVETILTEDTIDTDDVLTEKSTNEKLHSSKQLKIDSSSQRLKEEEEERISALKTRLMSTVVKRSLKRALLESEIKSANARRDFYQSKKSLLSLKSVASNTKTVSLSLTEQKILKDLKEEKSAFNIERSILQKQLVEAEKKAAISIKTYYEMKKSLLPTLNPCS